MWQQSSYQGTVEQGKLYVVPTPIGNLDDMTYRAIEVLKQVDLIAAEDTRQTKKLCNHFEITTPLVSYHEHNKLKSGEKLLEKLQRGNEIAVVSDAGMPGISDPGYELIEQCIRQKIAVIPLPGANAVLPSLVGAGLPTEHFYFYGFLPRDKKTRKEELDYLSGLRDTIVFYESPHRIKETLKELQSSFGSERKASLARELSKRYEEFIRGTLGELYTWSASESIRGEFCLVIEGSCEIQEQSDRLWWSSLSIEAHVEHYMEEEGLTSKEAIKKTAADRNLPKRDVYQAYHIE